MKIHGGQVIARALKAEGVDTVFALTGGHIVAILDGCVQEGIRIVDVRHEQAAAHCAEAYGRLTGKLGVALVTAGPGVTDAITGVANAFYSNTPMLLLGGRHLKRQELMGGLQEMDHPRMFHSITAWSGTAWETNRLADHIAHAARAAFAGRGGPVFLDIPMDVGLDMVSEEEVNWPSDYRANQPRLAGRETLDAVVELLAASAKPVFFAGGGFDPTGAEALRVVAEALDAPVYVNSRARGSLPFGHRLLGNNTRTYAFGAADVVVGLGVDWDFRTGYGRKINPAATVVQVDADSTKIGWNRAAHVGIEADPAAVVGQIAALAQVLDGDPSWADEIRALEDAKQAEFDEQADDDSVPVMPQRFGRDVAAFFGTESIIAVDGGDIVSTTARWLQVSEPGHVLDPGPFGTLGTGVPFAIAAKVAFPDRRVGIVFGDGGFGFNGMEYDTLVRLGLPVVGVMGNDGVWSNIKTFHRAFYPERLVATDLGVGRYDRMVEGLGGYGEFVTDPAQIRPALERAEASGLPALVNVHLAETVRTSSNYSQ